MNDTPNPSKQSRILVCEDSDFIRRVIGSTLKKAGHTIVEARDGAEARRLLASEQVDMILSDYNMPELNGLELLRMTRADAATAKTPVVMLSSETRRDLIDSAMAAGASAWLTKPFQTAELLETIEKALGQPAAL